jgi:hypothetical protein
VLLGRPVAAAGQCVCLQVSACLDFVSLLCAATLQMHCLERAGHWLQSDNPEGLHAMMLPWMRDIHENHLQW